MSFHDDSHILSQLGILDSNERSPKRDSQEGAGANEKQKFVDVRLNPGESDSDEDSDTLFDRNNLLSARRQNSSLLRRGSENITMRYIITCLLFIAAGMVSLPGTFSSCSAQHTVLSCFWICAGMLFGSYSAKFSAFRGNLQVFLIISLAILIINTYLIFNASLFFAARGVFIGNVLYGGALSWFGIWRKQPRKILMLILLFSMGSMVAMIIHSSSFPEATSNIADMGLVSRSIQAHRFKRDNDEKELLPFAAAENVTEVSNTTETINIKKPEVATGNVQKVKTKTEENAEKELEIVEKLKTVMANTTTSTTTTTSSTTTTTTTTTTSTTTTTTTTTLPPITTTSVVYPIDVKTRQTETNRVLPSSDASDCPSADILLSGSTKILEDSSEAIVKTFSICVFGLFTICFAFCCFPCTVRIDSKIKKLENDSTVGLRMRLRLTIAAIQTILGFLQLFGEKTQETIQSDHIILCVSTVASSIVLVGMCERSGTIFAMFSSFAVLAIGELWIFVNASSIFGLSLAVVGTHTLWITIFLTIEIFLQIRSTVQLAYFLIAWITGRILACFFAMESSLMNVEKTMMFLVTTSAGILLLNASRHLLKAKRLKEILDNSSAPIPNGASRGEGEYISLTAQDLEEDEDFDEDVETDRNSMDLDYELEQLGLEPVGAGSSRA
ncbi:unnamed protein product [Caenorhabditis bovis]|uniref:Uncharacterized protein n=1 Tax=Caenorhabditis bovis TaxID=2654633 RepID=A0A8S1ERX2_9PELO|nr:unnamed protein product [Caenorhabditis bovis]